MIIIRKLFDTMGSSVKCYHRPMSIKDEVFKGKESGPIASDFFSFKLFDILVYPNRRGAPIHFLTSKWGISAIFSS